MRKIYLVRHNLRILELSGLMYVVGFFLILFLYSINPEKDFIFYWFLLFLWIFVFLVGMYPFRRCMLYRVDIEEEGIRLYFIRLCDVVIDTNYRDRNGKKVKDKRIEMNREEGWILIRWEDIEEVKVGVRLSEPKCDVLLRNGHRVKFLNFVDREIVDAVKRAYKEYKKSGQKHSNKRR